MTEKKMVPLGELNPETYYNAPLWLDEDYLLLGTDSPVTESMLTNLRSWGYKGVWTDGSLVSKSTPASREAGSVTGAVLNNDAKETEGRHLARSFFQDYSAFVQDVYNQLSRDGQLDLSTISEKVKEVIQMIKDYKPFILRLSDLKAEGVDYLFTHSARSTIIALTIGDTMRLPNFRLIELGIAATLHEIGMMKIPRQIYDKTVILTEAEKKIVATHPSQALKMLQEFAKDAIKPLAQEILLGILQHHERMNGSGYPQGLDGDSIMLYGKIVAVACSYDAQISKRPYRKGKDGYTAMLTMLKEMRSLYDEKVVSALLMAISIFPLGSYVRLQNGAIGIVVDTGSENPKFPVVKLHLDENSRVYKGLPVVKTRDEDGLAVAAVLSESEIAVLVDQNLLPP